MSDALIAEMKELGVQGQSARVIYRGTKQEAYNRLQPGYQRFLAEPIVELRGRTDMIVLPESLPEEFGSCSFLCRHAAGSVNRNVAPWPSCDSTQIEPPYPSTIFWQIARPIPVPGYLFPCRRLKMPKTCLEYCGSIPMPLSHTEKT